MKNLFPLFLLLLTLASGCKKSGPVTPVLVLKGEISQPHDSTLTAIIQTGLNTFKTDTVSIRNNRFELIYLTDSVVKINLLTANRAHSLYLGGGDTINIAINNDSLNINGKLKPFTLWSIHSYMAQPTDSLQNFPSLIRQEIEVYKSQIRKTAVGQRMPYVLLKNMDGKNVSTLESQGAYRLISFWASWDTLSLSRMKQLPAIARRLEGKAISYINISLDSNDSIWRKEVKALKLPGNNVRLPEGFASDKALPLGLISIPENIVLNNESMIVHKNIFGKELEDLLIKNVTTPKKAVKKERVNVSLMQKPLK